MPPELILVPVICRECGERTGEFGERTRDTVTQTEWGTCEGCVDLPRPWSEVDANGNYVPDGEGVEERDHEDDEPEDERPLCIRCGSHDFEVHLSNGETTNADVGEDYDDCYVWVHGMEEHDEDTDVVRIACAGCGAAYNGDWEICC